MRLTDEVARQAMDVSDPKKVRDKLDSEYLANNVHNIVVVGRVFNFRLDVTITFQDNFDNFWKLIQEVARDDEHFKTHSPCYSLA